MAASSLTAAAKAARLDISQSGVEESPASSTQTSARKPDELNPGKALMEDSAAMFEDESKNWFLLSSYHFLPQGVVVVKEAFEKEIKAQGLVVGKVSLCISLHIADHASRLCIVVRGHFMMLAEANVYHVQFADFLLQ